MPLFVPTGRTNTSEHLADKYISFDDLSKYTLYRDVEYLDYWGMLPEVFSGKSGEIITEAKMSNDFVDFKPRTHAWASKPKLGVRWGDTKEFNPTVSFQKLDLSQLTITLMSGGTVYTGAAAASRLGTQREIRLWFGLRFNAGPNYYLQLTSTARNGWKYEMGDTVEFYETGAVSYDGLLDVYSLLPSYHRDSGLIGVNALAPSFISLGTGLTGTSEASMNVSFYSAKNDGIWEKFLPITPQPIYTYMNIGDMMDANFFMERNLQPQHKDDYGPYELPSLFELNTNFAPIGNLYITDGSQPPQPITVNYEINYEIKFATSTHSHFGNVGIQVFLYNQTGKSDEHNISRTNIGQYETGSFQGSFDNASGTSTIMVQVTIPRMAHDPGAVLATTDPEYSTDMIPRVEITVGGNYDTSSYTNYNDGFWVKNSTSGYYEPAIDAYQAAVNTQFSSNVASQTVFSSATVPINVKVEWEYWHGYPFNSFPSE